LENLPAYKGHLAGDVPLNLLTILPGMPLRTLGGLHLALTIKEINADILVTADQVMALGAEALGFSVVRFRRLPLKSALTPSRYLPRQNLLSSMLIPKGVSATSTQ